ncbi:response regulator [Actinophytocola xanthii]|uniref:Response regulator n=1 Tax=Actinophytocola xanthii TaxID=1912961 RepID=A0A1Q8BXR3_9PSEU|nr:response regulator [Actinophytocola xanthii]
MLGVVIDDSRAMRKILRSFLADLGFEVLEAGDGQEALEVVSGADSVPELALIDWNMPVMNGLEFVLEVRKRPEWRSMTLVMVTTESEHSQIVKALASGAHEYVIKPFTKDGMIDKLALLGLVPVGVL